MTVKVEKAEPEIIQFTIAAYNAYQRAGDSQGMANARARFPSKEELFTEGLQVGSSLNTGCWIGESVTLATRD